MFKEYFDDVVIDRISVAQAGDSVLKEARSNCWSFGLPEDKSTSREEIAAFLCTMARIREEQLLLRFGYDRPMTFYAWADEQAGQLRFSMETALPTALCFDCPVLLVNAPETIADVFLHSPYLHGIPWSGLQPSSLDDPATSYMPQPLPVWAIRVGEKPQMSTV